MKQEVMKKLLNMLPEGRKKQELISKYKALQAKTTKRGGDGLQDSFEITPVGHIKIETINDHGEVTGVLADQPNLVVDGAEEILLRSFSGDPKRILYKNRIPKNGSTSVIHIEESLLSNENLFDGSQLLHAPNIIWSAVNDEEFDVHYGYYPVMVYLKEEPSTEFGHKAFSIHVDPDANRIPLSSEIYSTHTNMFIGIGEGKNYEVDLNDSRLSYSEGISVEGGKASTTTETDEISFTQKVGNFEIEYEASNQGAQIDVFINDVLEETIESYDSGLVDPEIRTFSYEGLDNTVETTIRIVHSGSDSGVSNPSMSIVGIKFDALDKRMNELISEFKNYETNFHTPTVFNTTPMGPYTIQLPNFPLQSGSVQVSYNELNFTEVEAEAELTDTSFIVDEKHGILTFNRALTGVFVKYSVTGEIYDTELVSTMDHRVLTETRTENQSISGETTIGVIDGANTVFQTGQGPLVEDSLVVYKDGASLLAEDVLSIDLESGEFVLAVAPEIGEVITVDYQYVETITNSKEANAYQTAFSINDGSLKVYDQEGDQLAKATDFSTFNNGSYMIDPENGQTILISQETASGEILTKIEVVYASDEQPGVPTNYTRAIIEKPKSVNEYPWFELDKGSVRFVAEFPELNPSHNVTIREMGLFDGPRADDQIIGFRNFPVKAFSLVRVGDTRKDSNTGIRITWTITMLNDEGLPYQGGNN